MPRRDFPVSKNFRLRELERSDQHPELVEGVPDELLPDAIKLVVTLLQPLRERFGKIEILSGYRPPKLNRAIGGSASSQHMRAQAADLVFHDVATSDVFKRLRAEWHTLPAGQIIHYPMQGFLHVALPSKAYPITTCFVSQDGALRRA